DFAGLIRKRPIQTILMSICLLNLAGLPIPPAGFFAKIFIFKAGLGLTDMSAALNNLPAAASQHFAASQLPMGWLMVIVALITSIPAIYYYTRVVIMMVVPEPSKAVASLPDRPAFVGSPQEGPWAALIACTIAISLAGTFMINAIMDFSKTAAASISPEIRREIGYQPVVPLR
ncbi:MAG: hypothetical protein K8F91_19665, partial [Candidatus Obscuribacterales bacterium]|nr:hypothetical protein [Candidatus Obscuribacterales bacterium]